MAIDFSSLVDIENSLIDRRALVDRQVYERELEQIFARCWLYLCHDSQVPHPGDFVTAYMGEDPVLVVRDSSGKVNAFLNTCRHRGMRVCRADAGNAASFTCSYHGWTYGNDGRLIGVPNYQDAYFEELDLSRWGLIPVAQIDSYKGLIFATFDPTAPPLREYLGDWAWYVDRLVDRREGGIEVVAGVHKWIIPGNWKLAAENFIGDSYHFPITHGGAARVRRQDLSLRGRGFVANVGNGHGMMVDWPVSREQQFQGSEIVHRYFQEVLPEMEQRLGSARLDIRYSAGTVFPNFSTLEPSHCLRVWHPRGPDKTEVWSWCIVDKAAPAEVKEAIVQDYLRSFSPGGMLEQDDGENWNQCTLASTSPVARRYPFNYQMGRGHERFSEVYPGWLGPRVSEHNQRGLYKRWAELMSEKSWAEIRKSTIAHTPAGHRHDDR